MAGWDYEQISPPLNDQRVDRLDEAPAGEIDQLPSLNLDITDSDIIRNLDARIEDSKTYWDNPEGFNLRNSRNENMRLFLGKQIDVTHLYRFQVPYVENEIFVAEETIVSYLTNQRPQPEVYPAQDTTRSRLIAMDLEKATMAHGQMFHIDRLLEVSVRNLLNKRLGVIYFHFDPNHGEHGEIIPVAVDPDYLVIDKNAALGGNPAFICHFLKYSVDELCSEYPERKKEIFEALGIVRGTPKQMVQEIAVRRVWVTNYDKKGRAHEGCVTYFGKVVLSKYKNPNWLYSRGKNFLQAPKKPFVFLNYINDGQHMIDMTTPVEQAANMQNILNKRGRQIMENADKANGLLVISTDSGLTKDDAQNLTGEPNQKILIKTAGQPINSLVYQVPPHDLPSYVIDDKLDQRTSIHNIMGTPNAFTGSDADRAQDDKTLGQAMMAKNQASGRQDLIVRCIDRFMDDYFNFLVQMMLVWYDEDHYFVYNGGDGEFDYITMNRDLLEDGMAVTVKSGTTLPFDKSRQESVALNLAKMGMIDPYNLFKDLHMDNPQKRYDSWFKWKTNPQDLARDTSDAMDESSAYVDFVEIMNGKEAKPRQDATKEHILTHRKQMLTDEFLHAKTKLQNALIKHIKQELASLELRTALDEMGQESDQLLNPDVPIQPPMPSQMPSQPGMGAPGMQPPGGMPPMQPGMPPSGPPMPPPMPQPGMLQPQPTMAGVMNTPPTQGLVNQANPRIPAMGNPTGMAGM